MRSVEVVWQRNLHIQIRIIGESVIVIEAQLLGEVKLSSDQAVTTDSLLRNWNEPDLVKVGNPSSAIAVGPTLDGLILFVAYQCDILVRNSLLEPEGPRTDKFLQGLVGIRLGERLRHDERIDLSQEDRGDSCRLIEFESNGAFINFVEIGDATE